MVVFEPFIQWPWFLNFLLKNISGQGLFPYMLEYTFIVQYQKQNKQRKSKLFQMNTGSSKAPTVEMWSWLSRERRVSQRGSPPLVYQIIREMATMRRLIIMRWMSKAKIMMRMIVLRTWCTGWGGWRPARGRGRSRPGRGRRWGSRSWGDGSVWPWHHGGDDGGGVPERSGDLVLQALIWRSSLSLFLLLRLSRFN